MDSILFYLFGHFLGDYYFQTAKMCVDKNKGFKGVLNHSLEYSICMIFIPLLVFLAGISTNFLIGAIVVSLIHFLIDTSKMLLITHGKIDLKKKNWELNSYIPHYFVDQFLHILSCVVVGYLVNFSTKNYGVTLVLIIMLFYIIIGAPLKITKNIVK